MMTTEIALGWVSAPGGKWHRATNPEPQWDRDESTACGMAFRPTNVTHNGDTPWTGDLTPFVASHLCQRAGCAR